MMTLRQLKNVSNLVITVLKMSKLAWEAQPACFAGLVLLELMQGGAPLAGAWVTKTLFDLLDRSVRGQAGPELPQGLLLLLVAQSLLAVASQLGTPMSGYLYAELGRKLTLNVQSTVYRKINGLVGLAPFEDPQLHDTIQLAARGAQNGPLQTLRIFTTLIRNTVTLGAFLGVLLSFNPLLAMVVGLAVLPQLYAQLRLGRQRFGLAFGNSPKERRASYYGTVLSAVPFAKEVRLFNLAEHFLQAFQSAHQGIHLAQRRQQARELRWQGALAIFTSVVAAGTFAVVALQAFTGRLSLGDVTLYINAVTSVQAALSSIAFALAGLGESALFHNHYTALLALPQALPVASPARPVPPLTERVELRNVSFRYSDRHPWILRNVNLIIPVGQCMALVGLNGAGKTTLVKLLTRLYDPTEGQILWDGTDLRAFDPQDLRRCVGTILQDFQHYDLTAYENIGLGDVERLGDSARVRQAAVQAGINDTIEALPRGYQTVLSRWLADDGPGVDLSGGEWQKIAMARMFMREANLLILDEPTAALDAEAEYDLYRRFVDLVNGRTSLLISHRFSTVRLADIVAVLEKGRITQYGSHEELMARGGSYADLYHMQAEQYQYSDSAG